MTTKRLAAIAAVIVTTSLSLAACGGDSAQASSAGTSSAPSTSTSSGTSATPPSTSSPSPSTSNTSTSALSADTNGEITLSAGTYSVTQSSGSIILTIIRSGGKKGAYSVSYATANGTASAGTNYTAENGTIKWADGDASTRTLTVSVNTGNRFSGNKTFSVSLKAGANTMLGATPSATVTIKGAGSTATSTGSTTGTAPPSTTPTPPPASSPPDTTPTVPSVVKSIKQWVSCTENIDESSQLAAALAAAANNAFTLQIDCPVRLHTGTAASKSITVPDGVTVKFSGSGEFLMTSNGPPALSIAHPTQVTFIDYNQTFL